LEELKIKLEELTGMETKDSFARAFQRWLECFEK
jgi:hypothetical protein